MKKTYGAFAAALLLGGLASCSDDNPWIDLGDGQGAIKLSLQADGNVATGHPQTRANASDLFEVPSVNDFKIHLLKSNGETHIHCFHDEFLREESFPTGIYTLKAYYGDINEEGFGLPYFEGEEEVTVLENKVTEVAVNAKVANSLVTVEYTDGFRDYMTDFSASVHSEGHSYISIPADETRPVFLHPGQVTLAVTFTNPQGQELTLSPADFPAEGGHHYNIRLDVNEGNNGVAVFEVVFDDELTDENVYIDLTDELFTAPAPKVNLIGFEAAEDGTVPTLEFLAGEAPDSQYRFNVLSYGGLRDVTLTLNVLDGDKTLARELNLISASAESQAALAALGIDCKGIFKNPDKMALIDFSKLPARLPSGDYELSVVATDLLTRQSQPVTVRITSVAPNLEVIPVSAIYGLNTGTVTVNYNGSHPEDDITFKAMDKWGNYVDAPIIPNTVKNIKGRVIENKEYTISIKLPEFGDRTEEPVKVYLFGQEKQEVRLPVEFPKYDVQADAFARKVLLKVVPENSALVPVIAENLKVYNGSSEIKSNITRDTDTGIITVSGLNPQQTYEFTVSLINANTGSKSINFTTEEAKDVDNGSFEQTVQTINENINTGGIYRPANAIYTNLYNNADIIVSEPTSWANLNELTYYRESSSKNTWFMIPSTYMDNGAVVIRSVGYHHNGTEPAKVNGGANSYYNPNPPTTFNFVSGELFLGTYENAKNYGIQFESRPSSISFDYKYDSYNNEVGEVIVQVLNSAGTVIASIDEELAASAAISTKNINLSNYPFKQKAASLRIIFKSTKGTVSCRIPEGADLDVSKEADNSVNFLGALVPKTSGVGFHIPDNLYKAKAVGSVLTIDNVKLNY